MQETVIRDYLCCAVCQASPLEVVRFDESEGPLRNAVVTCPSCRTWYRLEDGLLEMLAAPLRDLEASRRFRDRFRAAWTGWEEGESRDPVPSDAHKLEQKQFYDADAIGYEQEMIRLPFWQAFDRSYLGQVRSAGEAGGVLVELGGGTGRMSFPVLDRYGTVLSFDISEAMARTALQKAERMSPRPEHVHFFVADAESAPLLPGVADVVSLSGILHHVESPDRVLAEAARVLKPGGVVVGNENNRSAFRFLFDWLMAVRKLWNEKAHEHHFVMSSGDIGAWCREAGLAAESWTSVFLPPHLFNLLSPRLAERVLTGTDAVGRALPWLRDQGGLVLYRGRKGPGA